MPAGWTCVIRRNMPLRASRGALFCPLQDLRSLAKDLDQGFEYICYCKTGRRSSAAAFLLSQLGFRACVLKDGLQALPAGAEE